MTDGDLRGWLVGRVALLLDVAPQRVEPQRPLADQGLDSVSAVALIGELEDRLRRELDQDLLYDHPAIDDLVDLFTAEAARPTYPKGAD